MAHLRRIQGEEIKTRWQRRAISGRHVKTLIAPFVQIGGDGLRPLPDDGVRRRREVKADDAAAGQVAKLGGRDAIEGDVHLADVAESDPGGGGATWTIEGQIIWETKVGRRVVGRRGKGEGLLRGDFIAIGVAHSGQHAHGVGGGGGQTIEPQTVIPAVVLPVGISGNFRGEDDLARQALALHGGGKGERGDTGELPLRLSIARVRGVNGWGGDRGGAPGKSRAQSPAIGGEGSIAEGEGVAGIQRQ